MTALTINPSASAHDAWEAGTAVMTLTGEIKLTAATAWGGLLSLIHISEPTRPY